MTPRNSPLRSGADFEIVTEELTPEDVHRATFGDVSRGGLITEAAKGLRRYMDGRSTGDFAVRALEAEQAGDQAAFDRLMAERATRLASSAPDAPRVAGLTDVRGLRDAVDWAGSTLGEGLPSLGPSIVGAIAGRRLLGGVLGNAPAAAIGSAYPAYHDIRAGEVDAQYSDPALAAASADDRARTATQTAGLSTALEVLLPSRLVGGLGRSTRIGRALTGDALTETVTEGGQSAISQFGNMGLDPGREFSYKELVDSAAAGGLVGGAAGARTSTVHGAVSALGGLRDRAADFLRRDPQPGADAAPPGTPLLPAPDDGSGGGVGGLYDTLNERFGDGIRDRAQKTKDYVSDTIDRMGEAAKTAETPQDFLRQVFGNSAEEAAADLRPDTEDPYVLNAADPAAALQQRDAQRQERAALFAAELLNDPATPESVKERVASFGGDFSNPEAQAFVARNLVAQRAGEKLANAVGDLFDLTKDFGGKATEAGTDLASKARDMIDKSMSAATDRIVKKNLQDINEADVAPLVTLMAQRLGPAKAAEAPKLARQLVAAANRLSPDARITEETDRRLRNFSTAIDDEVLDLVTELSGSDALRNTIAKIRSIPSAASDVRQSGGHSFLESMLKQPLEPAVLSQLSEFVDALGLQLGSMSSERKNQVLSGLATAFGSKREAQIVVEYYGNIRRDALRRAAERGDYGPDADVEGDLSPGEAVATLENPDGTVSYGAEFGSLTEQDAAEMTASYRDPNPARPFFRATDRAALRKARRAAPPGSRVATLREYVAQTGENPKAVAARVRQDLRKRLTDAENRDTATVQEAIASMEAVPEAERSEDFNALLSQLKARKTENRTDLPGLRKQMEAIEKASGVSFNEIADLSRRIRRAELADEGGIDNGDIANLPALRKQLAKLEDRYAKNAERVLEKYAVVMRPKDETFANDELMAKFRGLLDKLPNANVGTPAERAKKRDAIAKIKKTAIKFNRKGSKTPITLSAESMAYASQARGSMEERFLDSLAAVLARPDIEGLVPPAPDTLISRRTGLTWGDIAPEKPVDNRTERQKRAQREKDATAAWAKQERMRLDIETWPKLMAALRDVQRRFLADRLGLTLAPDEAISLTDLIDRFPAAQRRAMRNEANEAAFQSALGWAKKLSRKLVTATERNYADESRMRVLEKYIDEQLNDRFPMPEGDERASRRIDAENQAAGVHADEGGIGGAILDAEAEIEMLEERLDAVEGIDGLTRKYARRVEEAQTELDRLADSVGSPEQRDARVPGRRQDPRDAGRTGEQPPKPGKGPAETGVRSAPSTGRRVVLPSTSPYTAKDQAKSDRANKFIGRGAPGSSTAAYAKAWGDRANTGVYTSDDVVFISVNGNRPGALPPPWAEIKKAMSAGATLITDTPADRARNFNTGERAVAEFLSKNGYRESSPGTWVWDSAVRKNSFVGAKADPEGAKRAAEALEEAVVGDKPDVTAADIDAATTRAELMYMLRHRRIPQSLFARFRQRSENINSRVQGAAQAELRQSMVDGGIRKYVRVGFAEVLEQVESVKDAKNAYDALIGLQGFLPPPLREIADKYLSGFKAELEGTKFSLQDRRTGLPNALSEHVLAEFSMGGDIELTVIGRHIAEEAYVRAMGEPRSGISPAYAVLHEITHALTVLREATDPVFRAETRRLYDATAKALTREQSEKFVYAMADTQEFLAEAMANPAFREVLRGIRDSGKSVLDRLMDAVRKTLGLRRSEQSLLSSVEELVYGQPPVSASVTKKNSFVGAKADPEGASDAEKLLGIGAPANVVWRELGWFRGPDGKLRKEVRSPVLRRRVREFATAVANGSRSTVAVRDLLEGIDEFKPYLTELGDLQVDPNDSMVELMGAIGAYSGEDGFSSRGIGISRVNAELAVRTDAVPGGKGVALLRELADSMSLPELADMGLNFVDPTDLIAELEARYPMPDVNERVAELLTGTILHELQHAFQHVEGFENGGNATTAVIAKYGDVDDYLAAVRDGDEGTVERITEQAFAQLRAEVGPDGDMEAAAHELYESIVGEVEANDVAARMKLDDAEARTVAPALADAKREFVRSVLLAEALSAVHGLHSAASGMGAKKGRPGKNWGDKAAVKAEILRLRGKDVKVRIDKLVKDLGGSGQYTYDRATGERLIEVAINAASPLGTARHEAMHDLFRFLSKDPATRSIAKDLRDATSAPHVITRLRELLKDHKGALEQLSDPEERAAYAYQFWAEGLLRIGPTGTGVFNTIRKFLRDLFGIVTAGQRGEDLLQAFHDGKFADPSTVQEVLQDLNDKSGDRLRNKMERAAPALVKATRAVFTPAVDRLRSFENDSLNELADKFFTDTGRSGFIQNKYQQEGVWMNRLATLLEGTTATERREAIDQLQAMAPKSPLAKALAKYNKDIYEYMRDAGVKSWDSQKKAFVPLREVQNYFTRSWDADAIAGNRAEFEALLRKEGGVSATDAAAIADNLARGTEARPGPKEEGFDLGYMPYAPHTSERVLTFINQSNAQAFAKFQHKDLADIMTMYTRSAVHRAEYAREFGNNGERIVALVKSSGVRGKDALTEISNSVQALEGSLDPGKWSPETKQFMAGIQTLQNVVVLPLALASQMIDPIVLAARSGDIRDAGRAYITALQRLKNTVTKSSDSAAGEDLAKILGIVSEDSTLQAMAMAYGTTRMSKRMETINRVFFRYNGMQGWNDSMRIAATAAGERYLLANKRNAAALAELDLTSKDIKVDKNGRLDVSSPKVQQAMFRFVDQAVLRPSPAQRPVWMSDPRFLLVAHLKQFTFAMHNVVLKRANRELSAGNPKPWATLMLAMPVMLAADMAKFALTGSFPSTWGYKDYLMHAVERSGLLGLGDFGVQAMSGVGMGKAPGEELLGPSFEHLMELLRWIGGDPRTDFGDVIDRTVPGARFI